MIWDYSRLEATLEQLRRFGDDTTTIECKRAQTAMPQNIGETLCAFANMPEGGTILLGIDEWAGFAICGVDDPAAMEKRVADFCRQAVQPAPHLTFEHIECAEGTVVVVTVPALLPSLKPASFKGKYYLRQADGDYVMNSNDLRMIRVAGLHEIERVDYDAQSLPGTSVEQLDPELLKQHLAAARARNRRLAGIVDDSLLLELTNVVDREGNLRLGALYAMGRYPQGLAPALGATAAVRLARTDGNARHRNLVDLEGPVPELIEQTMDWIRENTATISAYNAAGHLVDRPEFPPSAVREVVANAFVHRDLGPSTEVGKHVEIRVTPTMLLVQNPGGLRGLSVAQLESREVTKAPVNQHLYQIAKGLTMPGGERVIEGEGGGIREVLFATQQARLRAPRFIDTGVQFQVQFPRGPRFSDEEQEWLRGFGIALTPPQEDVLIGLRRGETYSAARLRSEYAPMSPRDLDKAITTLADASVLQVADGRFSLAGQATTAADPSPDRFHQHAHLGKNVPVLLAALERLGAGTLKELAQATGLSAAQVRYALAPVLDGGVVIMTGGQGSPRTTYTLGGGIG